VAVSVFLPPAYTVTHTAAYRKDDVAPVLPLFAYSPLGWWDGGYVSSAIRIDSDTRQESSLFDREKIERNALKLIKRSGSNRLIKHLTENCALRYSCPAAMNYVLGRWEMPVPTSPGCNARCVGCISYQPGGGFSCTQDRIEFVPSAEEIVEAAVEHLENAEDPIVSFGQGCEGEPLLVSDVIAGAIRGIREETDKGTLNLNTNASLPAEVGMLFEAGLSSMRVSINSAREEYYHRYYRPTGYDFEDVIESVKAAKKKGGFVSLNYLVFPGFTDQPSEVKAMKDLVRSLKVDMIQWRNLNIDPDLYIDVIELTDERGNGIPDVIRSLSEDFPDLRRGYFNPYLGDTGSKGYA
jgi:pyruvate-formate lyase-activating enzyme